MIRHGTGILQVRILDTAPIPTVPIPTAITGAHCTRMTAGMVVDRGYSYTCGDLGTPHTLCGPDARQLTWLSPLQGSGALVSHHWWKWERGLHPCSRCSHCHSKACQYLMNNVHVSVDVSGRVRKVWQLEGWQEGEDEDFLSSFPFLLLPLCLSSPLPC